MVGLIFNEGISTCYVGFIRGEQEISFGHDEGHVRCFLFLLVRIWSYTAKFEILVTLDRNWS